MKKILALSLLLASVTAFAQSGLLDRFEDPEKGHTTFIPKGCRTIGISGSYRSLDAGGEKDGDGYSVLSLLNIGDGSLKMYSVAPSINFFVADDLSLGLRLEYSGYTVDTDLKADLRTLFPSFSEMMSEISSEDDEEEDYSKYLNVQLSARHMVHNAWSASFVARKYLSFFGSKTFGIFGEGRLFGKIGNTTSYPYDRDGVAHPDDSRSSQAYQAGIKVAAGAALRLREGSTLSVSIPIIGAAYSYTTQHKDKTGNDAHMSSFNISRNIDFLAIQVGYSRFIEPKKRK